MRSVSASILGNSAGLNFGLEGSASLTADPVQVAWLAFDFAVLLRSYVGRESDGGGGENFEEVSACTYGSAVETREAVGWWLGRHSGICPGK